MKSKRSVWGLFLAVLVLLPGCLHVPTYQCKPLKNVSAAFTCRGVKNNVIVQAKRLNKEEIYSLFDTRNHELDKALEVIYLSVDNFSNVRYALSPKNIDLSMLSRQKIVHLMKTNSATGVVGGVGGVIVVGGTFLGIFWAALCGVGLTSEGSILAVLGSCVVLAAASLAAGVTHSIKSMIMNKRIKKDLKAKTLHDKVIINSGDQYEGLIFVKSSDYNPQFTVTMHEKDNAKNSITFDVDLQQNECA